MNYRYGVLTVILLLLSVAALVWLLAIGCQKWRKQPSGMLFWTVGLLFVIGFGIHYLISFPDSLGIFRWVNEQQKLINGGSHYTLLAIGCAAYGVLTVFSGFVWMSVLYSVCVPERRGWRYCLPLLIVSDVFVLLCTVLLGMYAGQSGHALNAFFYLLFPVMLASSVLLLVANARRKSASR